MQIVAVDLETSGLSWQTDTIHGIAIAYEEDQCEYVLKENFSLSTRLFQTLQDPNIIKVFHNAGFDMKFLMKAGIKVNGPIYDTMLLAQLVDESGSLKLKDLAVRYFGFDSIKAATKLYKWLSDNNLKKEDIIKAPADILSAYATEDANNTYKLYYYLGQKLKETGNKLRTILKVKKTPIDYFKEEMTTIEPVLWKMEMDGVLIDEKRIEDTKIIIQNEKETLLDILQKLTKKEVDDIITLQYEKELEKRVTPKGKANVKKPEFNWTSNDQIGQLIFDYLGLKSFLAIKTNTGKWQCSDAVLKKALKINELPTKLHEFLKTYVEYTKTLKKLSTYIGDENRGLLSHVNIENKIHTSYKQAGGGADQNEARGTDTGRLSSANPNLQNLAPFARKFFIPSPGNVFLYFDYSQIELRLAAHFSKDPIFLDAYNNGGDIHRETAAAVFNIPTSEVTKEQRQVGKTVNFLLIYNGSANKLQQQLELPPPKGPGLAVTFEEATQFRDAFFEKYTVYKEYLSIQKAFMQKYKFVRSPFGRIRRLPEFKYHSGINLRTRSYSGPYLNELKKMLAEANSKKVKPLNYYGEPLTIYDIAKKKVAHALNQGYNFPMQSAAASITKRAMIALSNAGYTLVNQIHDSITIMIDKKSVDKHIKICQNIMESVVKLRVPLVAEAKILKSFDETDTI